MSMSPEQLSTFLESLANRQIRAGIRDQWVQAASIESREFTKPRLHAAPAPDPNAKLPDTEPLKEVPKTPWSFPIVHRR